MKSLAITASLITTLASSAVLAAPETYVIDPNHSMPRFEYSHLGYSSQSSRFDKTTGKITIDRVAKTGVVDVTIDATTVDSGFPLFNTHLLGEDFFNTAKYPTITFKSTSVKFDGDKVASVDGNLTVKGVTKPVSLTLNSFLCMPHPMLKKDACGATATTKIKRTDFNMAKYVPYVSDEVMLTIPVEAIKE